jgi:predicted acylesterase/phospholipase RssA
MSDSKQTRNDASAAGALPCCDLVMKGGITSGIIYPKLIHTLAQKYRFRNVGGTSAGAIAAGACAAAEYRRRETGEFKAFERLDALPKELSDRETPDGRSRLSNLFQPHANLRAHFAVLLAALNKQPPAAIAGMLGSMLASHAIPAVLMLLVGGLLLAPLVRSLGVPLLPAFGIALGALLVVGLAAWLSVAATRLQRIALGLVTYALLAAAPLLYPGVACRLALAGVGLSLLVGAVLTWVLAVAAAAWRFVTGLLRGLHRNGYGLCSGRTAASSGLAGLTDWLTQYFDELSGVSQRNHPLTFGDLWGGSDSHAADAVNLEVMTSAVSQQMIYGIPFRDGVQAFFYDPEEWKNLFPERVMDWISACADEIEAIPDGKTKRADEYAPDTIIHCDGRRLRPLPRGADLPMVVAIRMSLSFPILLSAVPLYSVDFSRQANVEEKQREREALKAGVAPKARFEATRIWFSDGGIGSNMPLHLFDALLPGHPTFAVNLRDEHPDRRIKPDASKDNDDGRVFLPKKNTEGFLRYWPRPNDAEPLGGLVAFLSSIVKTMQNWRDEIQFPYPGFKDRIVQISQRADEGGLNLDMPKEAIKALGEAGGMAAERLIDRFHQDGDDKGDGWDNHQVIRLGTFLGVLQPSCTALGGSAAMPHWKTLAEKLRYNVKQAALAQDFLDKLGEMGDAARQDTQIISLESGANKPLAQIRISPKI